MKYTAIIKELENGWYFAQCEQLPGALTQGRSLEEVRENIKEAIRLYLETNEELTRSEYAGQNVISDEIVMV